MSSNIMNDNLLVVELLDISSEDWELTSEEVELSKSIVTKCGGLPKVIAAISEVSRSGRWWFSYLSRNFMGNLEMAPEFHSLRDMLSWMKSYFDACSDSLKPCIFYLSIFSAEKNIRRRRLLWWWTAEGYCRDTSDGRTCEENGEKFISELVNLSIIQWSASSKYGTACAKSIFFEELKKLMQLRKLSVSGINMGNIKEFCEAISGHAHLTSLSVELDKYDDLDGLDDIPQPPKTIKSLKLYGHVNKLLVWIGQLGNKLEKLNLDLTTKKPEEFGDPESPITPDVGHLRIRPIQDGELHIGLYWRFASVVEIQCSSVLHIKFDDSLLSNWDVGVLLKVHFSGGSQSSLLRNVRDLKEVWLKGYTDVDKQYMQQQINELNLREGQERPVLKLVQTRWP
ncbi:putative disease resistance protein At4g10780 [Miscanthus floridulus]|uniref:putative disease resistance protein At4g10780 n=1 Tax=Miscanthus floridulus TaxID=154761 RepID=UPI003457A0AE